MGSFSLAAIMKGTSYIWLLAIVLLVVQPSHGQGFEESQKEEGIFPPSGSGLEKRYISQGRTSVIEQMISLLQNLKQGKIEVKKRPLSLHDSLKNLYLKHFAKRTNNPGYEDYQDEDDTMFY